MRTFLSVLFLFGSSTKVILSGAKSTLTKSAPWSIRRIWPDDKPLSCLSKLSSSNWLEDDALPHATIYAVKYPVSFVSYKKIMNFIKYSKLTIYSFIKYSKLTIGMFEYINLPNHWVVEKFLKPYHQVQKWFDNLWDAYVIPKN